MHCQCKQLRDPKAVGVEPQAFFSATQYKNSNPEWLADFTFDVAAEKDDEERPETFEIVFHHEPMSILGNRAKQDPDNDPEFGHYKIHLDEFVKLVPSRRQPDGSEEPAQFNGAMTKWFKLHDDEGNPVAGLDGEGPPSFQAQLIFTDSCNLKKGNVGGNLPIQLPQRPPYRPPAPKVRHECRVMQSFDSLDVLVHCPS